MRRSKSEAHELDPLPHGWEDDRKPAPLHAAVLEYCRENASMRGASSTDIERSWLKIWPTLEDAGITEAFQIETAVGRRTVLETLTKFTTNNPTEMGGTPAVVARRLSDLKKCLKGAGVSQKSLETLATAWSSKGRKGRGHSITAQWAKATGWVEEGSTGYPLSQIIKFNSQVF